MEMSAKDIELGLYRSGLLKDSARPHVIEHRCKAIKKHAAVYDRARLQMCNGIDKWDAKLGRVVASLTEEDQERLDATLDKAQQGMAYELKAILKRGTILDFRRDPRGAILRYVNKDNTRDGWIS